MSQQPVPLPARPPWHFWLVGLLSLFWNIWGAYIAVSAQSGELPGLRAEDAAYFDAQPLWFVLIADLGLLAGISGALALLLQHRSAVWLYGAELAILAAANLYDLAAGTSLMLTAPTSAGGSLVLFAIIAGEIVYARAMRRRGLLE